MKKCILRLNITLALIVVLLVLLVILNGEYLRPRFKDIEFLSYILGSLPNFIGSFVLYIIILGFFVKKIVFDNGISNVLPMLQFCGLMIFLLLTVEEYCPFFLGSQILDVFDIIANAMGVLCAFFLFKILIKKRIKDYLNV